MILVNNRDKIDWHENMSIQELLDKMNYTYSLITVSINDEVIQSYDYDEYIIPDNANVIVFHLAHGG